MDPLQIFEALKEGVKDHPYLTITALAIVEGRVNSVCVGALAAQGLINPFIAYWIFVGMCVGGDTQCYFLARAGRRLGKRWFKWRWWPNWRWLDWVKDKLKQQAHKSLFWALVIGKVTGFASKPAIAACGIAKMPVVRFYSITTPCTIIMFIIYMTAGYYFGEYILNYLS